VKNEECAMSHVKSNHEGPFLTMIYRGENNMLHTQPLDSEISKKMDSYDTKKEALPEKQYMGLMFEDLLNSKITLKMRLSWLGRDISNAWYDFYYMVCNWVKWRKTISGLRPWEGFGGVLTLVRKHLKDYLETEVKYGHSERSYREAKITSIRKCLEILERLQKNEYDGNALDEVYAKYPEYKQLITEYSDGSTSCSGDFIAVGNGWAGIEAGANPRRGYFEYVNGKFELTATSDESVQAQVEQSLEQIERYHADLHEAYKNAEIYMENDKNKLGELLSQHFFSWWD
jgi:hypothetical protein